MPSLIAACVQMCSSDDVSDNIQHATHWIGEAAQQGADLIVTPEMTGLFDQHHLLDKAQPESEDLTLKALRQLAAQLSVNLLIGSLAIKVSATHCVNRSYCINRQGNICAHYDKIHLFDAQIDQGYHESARIQAGEQAVVVTLQETVPTTFQYQLGMSICYDVRFAYLYRALAQAGADIITLPAAFTLPTGQAHWHVLVRARAIETGCFVLAAAQQGEHRDGRSTYGHSMIVDPWGKIMAERAQDSGIVLAQLDLSQVAHARQKIAGLQHDRQFLMRVSKPIS